jgi:hypothetical protein
MTNKGLARTAVVPHARSPMTRSCELFWSFRSPYSYLVTPGPLELERALRRQGEHFPGLSDRRAHRGPASGTLTRAVTEPRRRAR